VLTESERYTAFVFLVQHRAIFRALGVSDRKLDLLAAWLELNEEVSHAP
jgi:hypothetical protein